MDKEEPELSTAVAAFFGRPIEVGERAADALTSFGSVRHLWNRDLTIRGDLEIFSCLVAFSPAASQALMRAGFDLSALPSVQDLRSLVSTQPTSAVAWPSTSPERLLNHLFQNPWGSPGTLSAGGAVIRDSGLLTEIDLIGGFLSAAQASLTPDVVTRTLLSPLGLVEFGFVSPEGDAMIERAEESLRSIGYIDPDHYRYQYILFLDDRERLRIRPFGAGSAGYLDEPKIPTGLFSFRSGLVQSEHAALPFSSEKIEELEDLIYSSSTTERDFQLFFEGNPGFLSGLDFGRVFPQPILYKDDGSTLIPDFFLEKLDTRGHAILELKASTAKLAIRRKNRVYFSQWVQDAIAQLRYYRDWFEDRRNREAFAKALGLEAQVFRPRLVLVGGRQSAFQDEVERLRLLSGQEGNFELWTYDDLLDRAQRYRQFLSQRNWP